MEGGATRAVRGEDLTSDIVYREVECATFIGQLIPAADAESKLETDPSSLKTRCPTCRATYCLICGQMYKHGGHTCPRIPPSREADEAAFGDLVKGKDYQICPSTTCKRKIQLLDGCNHVYCTCSQSFCFICGESVAGGGGHWNKRREEGGCPRFNHPSMGNAMWEEDRAEDEEGEGEEAGLGVEQFRLMQEHLMREGVRRARRANEELQGALGGAGGLGRVFGNMEEVLQQRQQAGQQMVQQAGRQMQQQVQQRRNAVDEAPFFETNTEEGQEDERNEEGHMHEDWQPFRAFNDPPIRERTGQEANFRHQLARTAHHAEFHQLERSAQQAQARTEMETRIAALPAEERTRWEQLLVPPTPLQRGRDRSPGQTESGADFQERRFRLWDEERRHAERTLQLSPAQAAEARLILLRERNRDVLGQQQQQQARFHERWPHVPGAWPTPLPDASNQNPFPPPRNPLRDQFMPPGTHGATPFVPPPPEIFASQFRFGDAAGRASTGTDIAAHIAAARERTEQLAAVRQPPDEFNQRISQPDESAGRPPVGGTAPQDPSFQQHFQRWAEEQRQRGHPPLLPGQFIPGTQARFGVDEEGNPTVPPPSPRLLARLGVVPQGFQHPPELVRHQNNTNDDWVPPFRGQWPPSQQGMAEWGAEFRQARRNHREAEQQAMEAEETQLDADLTRMQQELERARQGHAQHMRQRGAFFESGFRPAPFRPDPDAGFNMFRFGNAGVDAEGGVRVGAEVEREGLRHDGDVEMGDAPLF